MPCGVQDMIPGRWALRLYWKECMDTRSTTPSSKQHGAILRQWEPLSSPTPRVSPIHVQRGVPLSTLLRGHACPYVIAGTSFVCIMMQYAMRRAGFLDSGHLCYTGKSASSTQPRPNRRKRVLPSGTIHLGMDNVPQRKEAKLM